MYLKQNNNTILPRFRPEDNILVDHFKYKLLLSRKDWYGSKSCMHEKVVAWTFHAWNFHIFMHGNFIFSCMKMNFLPLARLFDPRSFNGYFGFTQLQAWNVTHGNYWVKFSFPCMKMRFSCDNVRTFNDWLITCIMFVSVQVLSL